LQTPSFADTVATDNKELIFGVFPYLQPSQLVNNFDPLKVHLEKSLGRPIEIRTAPDFAQFVERTHNGEYDIIFTGPHMGRLAEKRDHFRPLGQTGIPIITVALARNDSAVKSLKDLRDRNFAAGSKMAMHYHNINYELGKNGLKLGKSVNFINTASFSNVIEAVLRGEVDAGAVGSVLWDNANAEQRAQLHEIYRSHPLPGFLLLGHTRNNKATLKKIQKALFDFSGTPAGKIYFAQTGHIDFRPIDEKTMKRMDPFTGALISTP
jgi:phosphonate transport system substrate-binding protein